MPKKHSVTSAPPGYGNLVLRRKNGEAIDIGGGLIKITMLETRGDYTSVLITAPLELKIRRSELKPE